MKDFILLMSGLLVLCAVRGCCGPRSHLPRFRVRVMRLRLHLRLHPGRGHASVFELWLRWGRLAAFRRSGRSRRSLTVWRRLWHPDQHSLVLGRAHYRHGLRVPLEEHVLVMAPPRTGKTGLLARIILHYPGPGQQILGRLGAAQRPPGDQAHVAARDRSGAEQAAQVVRGLGGPERPVLGAGHVHRVREPIRAADRGRGIGAPGHRVPPERRRHPTDPLRIEHMHRA